MRTIANFYLLLIAVSIIPLSACSNVSNTDPKLSTSKSVTQTNLKQKIALQFPNAGAPWQVIDREATDKVTVVAYTPHHEDLTNWTRLITLGFAPLSARPGFSARELYQMQLANAKADCKQVQTSILAENKEAMTYKFVMTGCGMHAKNQTQLFKVFNGKDAVYSVGYIATPTKLANNTLEKASEHIAKAKLVTIS